MARSKKHTKKVETFISPELFEELRSYSERHGFTRSKAIRRLIEAGLKAERKAAPEIALGFSFADGTNTTTGEGNDLRIAGQLYAFASEKERDEWVEAGYSVRVPKNVGEFRKAVNLDDLPQGWQLEDAESDSELRPYLLLLAEEHWAKSFAQWQDELKVAITERQIDDLVELINEANKWARVLSRSDLSKAPDEADSLLDGLEVCPIPLDPSFEPEDDGAWAWNENGAWWWVDEDLKWFEHE